MVTVESYESGSYRYGYYQDIINGGNINVVQNVEMILDEVYGLLEY